ncbi:MAG: LacI family DNA-binding transcriptional regulator [Arachidicoccus sp.]|nr:LacI family DNA-binding transcriptional regulator [Arachidicoccus sp.]
MAKKISIKDIANELKVAKSTVSFVLNGKAREKRISGELAERILRFIKEKGYEPNQIARSLSTGKTKMICLMVEKISDYFFSHIAFLLEELAYKNGYKIIFCSTENDTEKAKELLGTMRNRYVDGYIITPSPGIEKEVQELIQDNIPVVLFDRYFPDIQTDYVILDNYRGTYAAVHYLAKEKIEKIGFITLKSIQTQMKERLQGYLNALEEFKLHPVLLEIPFGCGSSEMTAIIRNFLIDNNKLDALVFATNYLTLSGIKALSELKIRFPEDILIIAFDDHEIFELYNPTISAVAQPMEKLANQLFSILYEKLKHKESSSGLHQIIIPAELKLRASSIKFPFKQTVETGI